MWIDEKSCTGCSACANACQDDAIQIATDHGGFTYPQILQDICRNCNHCKNICPKINIVKNENNSISPKVYVAWSLDNNTRFHSTSGGVFSELCKIIFADGGVAVGAQYGEAHRIEHVVITNLSKLHKIRQSKYAQSYIGYIYRQVEEYLINDKPVIFCGCPCQVAGLHAFLGKSYSNLFSVDFICRGSNSPKAYRRWLDMLENKYKSKVKRVWFKNKELGWNGFSTRVDFENGRIYRKNRYEDLFMRGYLEYNLYIRPSCTKCTYKGLPRVSDITLADFWGVDKTYDHDIGSSMIIVNNSHGDSLLNKVKDSLFFTERTLKEARAGNTMLDKSIGLNSKSDSFLLLLDKMPFDKAFKKTLSNEERKKRRIKLSFVFNKIRKKLS